jgi:hypothetical protein
MSELLGRSGSPTGGECDACIASEDEGEPSVLRCACGNLMARLIDGRIELKCRRCKRTVYIPIVMTEPP